MSITESRPVSKQNKITVKNIDPLSYININDKTIDSESRNNRFENEKINDKLFKFEKA